MLEHVTDYGKTIKACADLAQPGGDFFFHHKSQPEGLCFTDSGRRVRVTAARGTHEYSKFIKPSELASAIRAAARNCRKYGG